MKSVSSPNLLSQLKKMGLYVLERSYMVCLYGVGQRTPLDYSYPLVLTKYLTLMTPLEVVLNFFFSEKIKKKKIYFIILSVALKCGVTRG